MLNHLVKQQKWFVLSCVSLLLAIVYTLVFSTGMLLYPMLHVEQWLMLRPITRVDCVFYEWARLGEFDVSLLLLCVLSIACLWLGYRRRVFPYLLLLLLLGVGVELMGKQVFPQRIPTEIQYGLDVLHCPHLESQPTSAQLLIGMGAWWKAPAVTQRTIRIAHLSAAAPIVFDEDAEDIYGYPSGHTIRWSFLGLVACWLVCQHVRRRLLRIPLATIALLIAFGGGFAQFYIGYHLITDLIVGYFFGISLACCAIALLKRSRPRVVGNEASHQEDMACFVF